jgi:hypothetical protein
MRKGSHMTNEPADEERDYTHLPPKVRPEETVETQPTAGPNETGGPAGDPDLQFTLRHF